MWVRFSKYPRLVLCLSDCIPWSLSIISPAMVLKLRKANPGMANSSERVLISPLSSLYWMRRLAFCWVNLGKRQSSEAELELRVFSTIVISSLSNRDFSLSIAHDDLLLSSAISVELYHRLLSVRLRLSLRDEVSFCNITVTFVSISSVTLMGGDIIIDHWQESQCQWQCNGLIVCIPMNSLCGVEWVHNSLSAYYRSNRTLARWDDSHDNAALSWTGDIFIRMLTLNSFNRQTGAYTFGRKADEKHLVKMQLADRTIGCILTGGATFPRNGTELWRQPESEMLHCCTRASWMSWITQLTFILHILQNIHVLQKAYPL